MDDLNNQLVNSRYNIAYEENGDSYLFNARTASFIKLPGTPIKKVNWLVSNSQTNIPLDTISKPLLSSLKFGAFVVEKNLDELELIKFQTKLAIASMHKTCSLVIVPTLRCNMSCSYCFEKNKNLYIMSEEIQNRITDYIRRRLKNGCKNLSVQWFGGEPLLCFPIIKRLSKKMIDLCRRHKAHYKASIVSNGTLLTARRARELRQLKVRNVQVTLDGPQKIHDRRRPFAGGGGTFEKILKNIEVSCRILNVTVRCNADNSNLKNAPELIDALYKRGIAPHVRLYFSPVHRDIKHCVNSGEQCKSLFTERSFADVEPKLQEMVRKKGFKTHQRLNPVRVSCGAAAPDSFVVDAEGNLYKCSETIGMKDEVVGHIKNGVRFDNTYLKWVNFDPLSIEMCRSCKVLPMCFGWCPARTMQDLSGKSCMAIKYNIIEELKLANRSSNRKEEYVRQ